MTLKNLEQEIKTISGSRIMITDDKPLTFRTGIVAACEMYQGKAGSGDTLKAYNIGMKVMNASGEEVELSEEDGELLKKIIGESQQFVAAVVGRLLEFINN